MKISHFERDENNTVWAIGDDGLKALLTPEYIATNKPKVGDEYVIEKTEPESE